MTAYIQRGYSLFCQRVAQGRRMSVPHVNELAQGHVYLGKAALNLKLVDALGGLSEAVKKAAALAKLQDYYTENYPAPASWFDMLSTSETIDNYLSDQMHTALGDYYEPFMLVKTLSRQSAIQARVPFWLNAK